jgi:hypothetical protein
LTIEAKATILPDVSMNVKETLQTITEYCTWRRVKDVEQVGLLRHGVGNGRHHQPRPFAL